MEKQNVELPQYISLDYYDEYMHLQARWFNGGVIFQSLFGLVWVGGVLFGVVVILPTMNNLTADLPFFYIAMFAVIGGGAIYTFVAKWINKTEIFVSKQLIEIKIGPLFWLGNMRLKTEEITQFYMKKKIVGSKSRRNITYEVRYRLQNGNDLCLVKGMSSQQQVGFIVQKIEEYLDIENVYIPDEVN